MKCGKEIEEREGDCRRLEHVKRRTWWREEAVVVGRRELLLPCSPRASLGRWRRLYSMHTIPVQDKEPEPGDRGESHAFLHVSSTCTRPSWNRHREQHSRRDQMGAAELCGPWDLKIGPISCSMASFVITPVVAPCSIRFGALFFLSLPQQQCLQSGRRHNMHLIPPATSGSSTVVYHACYLGMYVGFHDCQQHFFYIHIIIFCRSRHTDASRR